MNTNTIINLDFLAELGIQKRNPAFSTGRTFATLDPSRATRKIVSPTDGEVIAEVEMATQEDLDHIVATSQKAYENWKTLPAPRRGEIVRQIGEALRKYKDPLGKLVTYEMGKIYQEGLGEVQEMIDICDFAVGQSRQLYGLEMKSERQDHRMFEQWHPLGIVGIISAFNFPVAVWSWNAMIAAIGGNVCIWKPSEKTPLTAIACQNILQDVLKANDLPEGIFSYIIGDAAIGASMSHDTRIPLVSATGSTRMGKKVAEAVGARLGKSLLELGGNNALIITENADVEMAIRATVFGAVGTCGQRCTSTRRLIVHASQYDKVKERLLKIYPSLSIGHPLDESSLVGPLIDNDAVDAFKAAINKATSEGGKLLIGGDSYSKEGLSSNYVHPAIVEAENHYQIVQDETFAPILYLIKYDGEVENAIRIQNDVKQGLSSAIFTNHLLESEAFLSAAGSDCGIANINIGTSGAEIGGAFGGEKETGGGRESGSDAWKAYMRRQTNTVNYGRVLPLAQGIKFDI
ncbi:L-piperidine-6-carboxylate dehydrogenase [Flammeovirga kamogawensis]|uniref:aldehyde dehydrogenase (NAD(+)) n=1 Tax=Flammeovirga kamogawensis TaxID=373891 RepID=A0ABX8GU75_9BACT|nr:aldehyde dehydrogenase family protein [Flammeovirga kamogawensis]MBB6459835.1 aldehyde dehydrogenase (NAD+) [Flammeovirga kamogawensis]QWG07111.1 aldehyde dehydrogenase family protein [Flammeovirga kamogawensis]TRX68932.1 aldehyde dehydrogenase family protein [Flammeovirga kamogawensis]